MADKHQERRLMLAMRGIQIEPRWDATAYRQNSMAKSKRQDMGKSEPSHTPGGRVKCCRHWGQLWQFLNMLNTEWPCDLAIPLLGLYMCAQENWKHMFTPGLVHGAHRSTIHSGQKVETTEVSISRWQIDKIRRLQRWNTATQSQEGMKPPPLNTNEPGRHCAEWKKGDTTGHTQWGSVCMKCHSGEIQRQKAD